MERKKEEASQRTIEFFARKYGIDLSPAEAKKVNERITCYFRLLQRWQKAQCIDTSEETADGGYQDAV